ncbi:proline rich transmembrane protein 1B-like isoform X2 [Patiria miniata]|uniref:Uncharacterized protein n=1 Tax=Patiria miniata TaxID=46514 RepID=A0A913ZMW5_PATMI|nr:proline rich transmembrane protein 1B-like isoform X2 [Patiria miniata]
MLSTYKPLRNECDEGVESAEMFFQPLPGQTLLSIPSFPPAETTVITSRNQPKDYQILAIFVTLFCCLPLGILGLVKSSEVRRRSAVGDSFGAHQASYRAKSLAYAGLGVGLLLWVCSLTAFIVYAVQFFSEHKLPDQSFKYEFVTIVVPIGK